MKIVHFFLKCFTCYLVGHSAIANAAPITWIALNPSSDMNNPANWNPSVVPGAADDAVFNSNISQVNKNPTTTSSSFSVSTFNFPNKASVFNINFNDSSLTFNGNGITGNQTNCTLEINNTDNLSFPGTLLSFLGSVSSSGKSAISISNSAALTGSQSNSNIGDITSQFFSSGPFSLLEGGALSASNTGNNSAIGTGNNKVANVESAQVIFEQSLTAANHCSILVSNTGVNSAQASDFTDFVAYLNDQQFFVGNPLQAGTDFTLTVSNTGRDTSTGHGAAIVAGINSNSGTTGNQILLKQGGTLGDRASLSVANDGLYSGTNTSSGSSVALMNLAQIAIGDSTSVGSYVFSAGNDFNLEASSIGNDSAIGRGSDVVGTVSTDQVVFFSPCSLGNNAHIDITKKGDFSGQASTFFVNVGSCGGGQFNSQSSFQAGRNFSMEISNSGTHSGSGVGNDFIGHLATGQQACFQEGFVVGDNAAINISNSASNSSQSGNNVVGSLLGYGKQLLINGSFQTGDNFHLVIANSGFNDGNNAGGNYVGFINNNTVDNTASQFHLNGEGSVGNQASISLSNSGTNAGSSTGGQNTIGVLAGQQFCATGNFSAGEGFSLTASNQGISETSGQNNHSIGLLGDGGQVEFQANCILGKNAEIVLNNSGTNHDVSGTFNNIGVVGGSQLKVGGEFSAGTHLNLSASNLASNAGDNTNFVGYLSRSQMEFEQGCTLSDGSLISAFNSGVIDISQITFNQGFNLISGRAIIQAFNTGSIGSFGIDISGNSAGGNVEIQLINSSLNVGAFGPDFTIGGLEGDSTSFVQSLPTLVIHTDPSIQKEFMGVIQDFPASTSTLIKTGTGSQKLSGANTYTGLTTIQEGTLIVKGSLAGDVLVNPLGTLKGSGAISGTLTNMGTISPGESIGILTVGNYVNNGGNLEVEVNGIGASDRINVLGPATINGGTVIVSSVDGTFRFQQPYLIVNAAGGVAGTYAGATSSAFITPTLSYDPNNVYLTLQSALINAAKSCNQFGVANALDNLINPNATQSLLIGAIANLPAEKAESALESLSGFQYTQDVWATEISLHSFLRRLYIPLRSLVNCCHNPQSCNEWTTWFQTGDGFTSLNGKHGGKTHGFNYEITGGIQKNVGKDFTLGLAGSYEYDHLKHRFGNENRHSEFAAAYGLFRPSQYYGLFDLVYGHSSNQFNRTLHASSLRYKAKGNPNLNTFTFYGEAGFDLDTKYCLIQPFIGIQLGKNSRSHVKENNKEGWGLNIKKHDWCSTSSRIGVHFAACQFCNCVDAFFDIAWNERWSSPKNSTTASFRQFGDSFRVCGTSLDRSSIDYALSFAAYPCEGLRGYLEIEGEWWRHANTLNIVGGLEFTW